MRYYKNIEGAYIVSVSTVIGREEITESEYNEIIALIQNRPTAPEGFTYKLRAADLEWELVELPPEPEPELDDAELLDILLGGDEG